MGGTSWIMRVVLVLALLLSVASCMLHPDDVVPETLPELSSQASYDNRVASIIHELAKHIRPEVVDEIHRKFSLNIGGQAFTVDLTHDAGVVDGGNPEATMSQFAAAVKSFRVQECVSILPECI